jgi:hemin uptake protein HemP
MSESPLSTSLKGSESLAQKDDSLTHAKEISSQKLLGANRSLLIHHDGVVYQLKLTKFNKLVLTK